MSDNNEIFVLEDGRKAEKVVVANKVNGLESQRVIEIKAEELRPLKTQQIITEKTRSYMYERVTETVSQETGEVVETKVETFDCITGALKEEPSEAGGRKLNLLSSAEDLGVEDEGGYDIKSILLTVVIAAQVAGLLYLLLK